MRRANLSNDFVNENFDFSSDPPRHEANKPRWKRVVTVRRMARSAKRSANSTSADYFPPEAKARALEMVNNLKEALADRIKSLDWMDEPTKQEALKKLAALTVKIGYPDKWRDYSSLQDRPRPVCPERHARRTLSKSIAT